MAVLRPGTATTIHAQGPARFVVIGGEPLDAYRHMWWNFVSSRKERIIQASADWEAQTMGHVPGEAEFIPLPTIETRLAAKTKRNGRLPKLARIPSTVAELSCGIQPRRQADRSG